MELQNSWREAVNLYNHVKTRFNELFFKQENDLQCYLVLGSCRRLQLESQLAVGWDGKGFQDLDLQILVKVISITRECWREEAECRQVFSSEITLYR